MDIVEGPKPKLFVVEGDGSLRELDLSKVDRPGKVGLYYEPEAIAQVKKILPHNCEIRIQYQTRVRVLKGVQFGMITEHGVDITWTDEEYLDEEE